MKQNRKILFFVLNWLIYVGFVQNYIYDHELLTLFPDLLIFYVAFRVSQKKSGARNSLNKYLGGALSFAISFLFLFTVLGAVINLMPVLSYLWGLRMLLRYVLLVWVIYRCFEMKDVKKYKKYMYWAFDINVVVCIFEFIAGIRGDWMSGTFSGNGVLMLHALLVMMLATADFFNGQMRATRYGIYIACMFMIAILAEIKMMYFLFPLTFYGGYVMNKKFSIMHVVVLVLAFFFLIPAMQFVMRLYYGERYVTQTFDTEYLREETTHSYNFTEEGFNRGTAIDLTDQVILTDPIRKVFGWGLGSGSKSTRFGTKVFRMYGTTMFWNFSTSYCLVELGWVGFSLFALCFVLLMWRYYKIYSKYKDPFIKYWAGVGVVSVGATFLLCWYNDNPYFKFLPMYFFWGVCFAAIEVRRRELDNKLTTGVYIIKNAEGISNNTGL